ncbi:MAG: 3-deoxy-D-manno-octulosonic acid transferase [Acidobacteria bacterium]|nr:3-deoxy-D-manno-octulosonic acid transferase [Acidobacteriota bacterium]
MLLRALYNLALTLCLLASFPFLLLRLIRRPQEAGAVLQKFGFIPGLPPSPRSRVWIHAVSVGELLAAQPLIQRLRGENFPLVISTTTGAGHRLALQLCRPAAEAVVFFPFDFNYSVRRSLSAIRPDLFLMVETEIWPNFLRHCARRGIPTLLVNGRISDRSFGRYRLIRRFLAQSLQPVHRFCMQTSEDARRLVSLGADPARVRVTGNLKYDIEPQHRPQRLNRLIREVLGTGSKVPLLVAGSTAEGEESMLLDALRHVRQHHVPLKMILAPRSPKRFQEVGDLLAQAKFTFTRRSFFGDADLDHPLKSEVRYDIFLLDSIGDLAGVYEIATVAFVGKSLVSGGGQNILEPAYFGKPILFGPSMENFREVAQSFLQQRAALQVNDPVDLKRQLLHLLQNRELRASLGSRASKIISDNRGAAGNTMNEIRQIIESMNH